MKYTLGRRDRDYGRCSSKVTYLHEVLYAVRICRVDLLRATCVVAARVTKSDSLCDRRLHRLVSYIHSSLDKRLVGFIGDDWSVLQAQVFTDANLAGCSDTQRSTSGVFHCIGGPRSCFPIAVVSKRQSCVSKSTPEAELVALAHGLRVIGYPAMNVWDRVLPGCALSLHEDNSTARSV